MARSTFFCVSDDPVIVQKAREFGQTHGMTVQVFSVSQWGNGLNNPQFRTNIGAEPGTNGDSHLPQGGKVLPFPGSHMGTGDSGKGVSTINELEAHAIEQAIMTFRGNLTEAAKALGIGRATLYRKVKQYNIDPSNARRKKVA